MSPVEFFRHTIRCFDLTDTLPVSGGPNLAAATRMQGFGTYSSESWDLAKDLYSNIKICLVGCGRMDGWEVSAILHRIMRTIR
jgi:hypothetical protein